MKRLLCVMLALTLCAGLWACAGNVNVKAPKGSVTVSTVDEFLAALGTAKTIVLAPGDYNLSHAENYGITPDGGYYGWNDLWDGQYELVLTNLENTVITGSGTNETYIVTDPRSACVLLFSGCKNVTLDALTVGHTVMAEACEGPVLYATDCDDMRYQNLGLFGCGTIGLHAESCGNTTVDSCVIYDCSGAGLSLSNCWGATVQNTHLRNIGKDDYGWGLINLSESFDVKLSSCTAEDSTVYCGISAYECGDVTFSDCSFTGNCFTDSVFSVRNAHVTVAGCAFEDNSFSRWYEATSDYAYTEEGDYFQPEAPEGFHHEAAPAEAVPVTTGKQKTVKAATMDEFLAALDSDTEIILIGKEYNIADASDYGTTGGKYYHWEDNYDGPQLVIQGIKNLTIHANSRDFCTISAEPRYANVFQFQNCANVTLHGFTAGHTKEPGQCMGGVLRFVNCSDCLVDECGLFGCGTLGVDAVNCHNTQVINTNIYECSYGGIEAYDCDGLTIGGCDFWDIGGEFFRFSDVHDATIDGKQAPGYYFGY